MNESDFLIIGGGIIGLSVARELKNRFPDSKIIIIEKENNLGLHASGRNSGVLHAGFYYTPDSLKARFTRIGNQLLTRFCDAKNIKINKCGKLVVARNENELSRLDELLERGQKNRVPLKSLSADEAHEIEPRAKTHKRALYSPTTATVNPREVLEAIKNDLTAAGIEIHLEVKYFHKSRDLIETSAGPYSFRHVINAAGLYADEIARDFGFSQNYRVLPFKGLYLYSNEPPGSLRTNIYPVPDLRNPFLGVHLTLTVEGKTKIGPTAIPAFWREQYEGFDNFNFKELMEIVLMQGGLLIHSDLNFKSLAYDEIKKYFRPKLVSLASALAEGVETRNYLEWGKSGIRAQLLDTKKKKLEMDFVVEGDDRSTHILNAVSPAFTCAFPFAEYVCELLSHRLK